MPAAAVTLATSLALGKTFIGAELLRQMRVSYPNDGDPLIPCPAGPPPMWLRMNEEKGLEVLAFGSS